MSIAEKLVYKHLTPSGVKPRSLAISRSHHDSFLGWAKATSMSTITFTSGMFSNSI